MSALLHALQNTILEKSAKLRCWLQDEPANYDDLVARDNQDILLHEVVDELGGSVRLKNCLKNPDFPFRTVTEYVTHLDPVEAVLHTPNAGQKTAMELDNIIKNFLSQNPNRLNGTLLTIQPKTDPFREDARNKLLQIFSKYKFPDFLLNLPLSARLENVLRSILTDTCPIPILTLSDCLIDPSRFEGFLFSRQSSGRKTVAEAKYLIDKSVTYILERAGLQKPEINIVSDIFSTKHDEISAPAFDRNILEKLKKYSSETEALDLTPIVSDKMQTQLLLSPQISDDELMELIKDILNEREFDVISRRTSFARKKTETLEEIAVEYNCTRERIRQIEKKAFRKCFPLKHILQKVLINGRSDIMSLLYEDADFFSTDEETKQFQKLSGSAQIAVEVVHKTFPNYLKTECIYYNAFWIKSTLEAEAIGAIKTAIDDGSASSSTKKRIISSLYGLEWPVPLSKLTLALPDLAASSIKASLQKDFCATFDDQENITIPANRLRSSLRLTLALRYAGRAVSLSEIRHYHNQLFNSDINENVAGSVLGRLEQALIVARGKYALYENIGLSSSDIAAVRNQCLEYLRERQAYISVKRMFDDLFLGLHPYGAEFNPYMVLGLLQDDNRFICKRGLMLGLCSFSDKDFHGLNEQIYKLANNYGPIDIKGIQEHLSSHRKVLDVTVGMVLDGSPEHIKIAPSTYDRISKIIGDRTQCQRLTHAIELALIDGSLSLYSLQERLKQVGFDYNNHVILSWLDKQDHTDRERTIINLSVPSKEIDEYNQAYLRLKEDCQNKILDEDQIRYELEKTFPSIATLDFRLINPTTHQNENDVHVCELDNLAREFDF